MVVFTCGHCGESVQKPKVEKHYLTKCRNKNPNLSCMDCFKDFLNNDYQAHIKCITEEQRYSAKGFQAKEKKGEKKQTAWVEMLQSVLDEQKNASKNVLRIIESITKHNNTPRKKPKFINFVKNICGAKTNPKDIDEAWNLISVKLSALSNANQENKNQNGEQKEKSEYKENNPEENSTSVVDDANTSQESTVDREETTINGENREETKQSKKQKKEEKKRKKYAAELLSAETKSKDVIEDIDIKKKGKKGKNKENINIENDDENEAKNKKKRKRQDTIPTIEVVENGVVSKESKKKLKTDEEAEESICLHDQNVAKSEEVEGKKSKFNWHEVIISVLKKKDSEMQFKRLQKKVLGEYSEFFECEVDDRIADKFIKKLRSAPNVRVDKNRVTLIEE